MFSPKRNKSENLINKVANLTINDAENNLINEFANLTINDTGNNIINKSANLTINNVGNDSKGATARDLQVQFAGNSARIFHQNLLSGRMIGIRQEEVPVLFPLTEPIIAAKNQLGMTISNGVIQTPQALNVPTMK